MSRQGGQGNERSHSRRAGRVAVRVVVPDGPGDIPHARKAARGGKATCPEQASRAFEVVRVDDPAGAACAVMSAAAATNFLNMV